MKVLGSKCGDKRATCTYDPLYM